MRGSCSPVGCWVPRKGCSSKAFLLFSLRFFNIFFLLLYDKNKKYKTFSPSSLFRCNSWSVDRPNLDCRLILHTFSPSLRERTSSEKDYEGDEVWRRNRALIGKEREKERKKREYRSTVGFLFGPRSGWFAAFVGSKREVGRVENTGMARVEGGLLECIMHAKWRGFLDITGAAPFPDEGVLRWRRGSLPTFGGWSFSGRRSVLRWELKYWRNYIARKTRNRLNNHEHVVFQQSFPSNVNVDKEARSEDEPYDMEHE